MYLKEIRYHVNIFKRDEHRHFSFITSQIEQWT